MGIPNLADHLIDGGEGWLTKSIDRSAGYIPKVDCTTNAMCNMPGLAQPLVGFQQGTVVLVVRQRHKVRYKEIQTLHEE